MSIQAPIGLLAELTHRCPLKCPYCSNPVELLKRSHELGTAEWLRLLSEAEAMGVLQVHLSGGEPAARADLEEIVAHCARLGLYSNLITSGVQIDAARIGRLSDAGLDHVQLSLQHTDAAAADRIGGFDGGHERKLAFAREVVRLGLPLTINAVIHRHNMEAIPGFVELALELGARRIEIAHAQYHGWALLNRESLLPTREQAMAAEETVAGLQQRHRGEIVIDSVPCDYHGRSPKPCMGGWGARVLNVTPEGKVLPCHGAETIPGLDLWSFPTHSLDAIWRRSPAFNAFRGLDWMVAPCTDCERKESCRGGCRCQALALTGRAVEADPVCDKSPYHAALALLAAGTSSGADTSFTPRK